jgi:hypothetical protein
VFYSWEGTEVEGVKNKVLWKIFGPKRDEVTRSWKNLLDQELLNLNLHHEEL